MTDCNMVGLPPVFVSIACNPRKFSIGQLEDHDFIVRRGIVILFIRTKLQDCLPNFRGTDPHTWSSSPQY